MSLLPINKHLNVKEYKGTAKYKGAADVFWRTSDGELLAVADMSTDHIFFVVRMIWNHSAPKEWRIEPYTKYLFNLSDDKEYTMIITRTMIKELGNRELEPYFRKCLDHMCRHINGWTALLEDK